MLTQPDGSDDWELQVGEVVPQSFEVEAPLRSDLSPDIRSADQIATARTSDPAQQEIRDSSIQQQLESASDQSKPRVELDNCNSIFSTKHIDAEQDYLGRRLPTCLHSSSLASPLTLVETAQVGEAAASELIVSDGAQHPATNSEITVSETRQAAYAIQAQQQDQRSSGEYAVKLAETAQQAAQAAQDAAAQAQQALHADLDHAAALAEDAQQAAQIAREAAAKAQEALQTMYTVPDASLASPVTKLGGICDVRYGQVYQTGDSPRFGAISEQDGSLSQKRTSQVGLREMAGAECSHQIANPLHDQNLSQELSSTQGTNSQRQSYMSTHSETCTIQDISPRGHSLTAVSGQNLGHLRALQETHAIGNKSSLHRNPLHGSRPVQNHTELQYESLLREGDTRRYSDPHVSEDWRTRVPSLQESSSAQDGRQLHMEPAQDLSPFAQSGTPRSNAPMQNMSPRQEVCPSRSEQQMMHLRSRQEICKDHLQKLQEAKESHTDDESGCSLM